MNKLFFSIIVPAYNVEKYLEKCICSLLDQDIQDYEIIVIDDCSTDNTRRIIDSLDDKKIKAIFKEENTGLSDTRNKGLEIASGEYILFIDSDDYVDHNVLKPLKRKIENFDKPDIVYMGHIRECDGQSQVKYTAKCKKEKEYGRDEYLIEELSNRNLSIPACFGIYKKEFLNKNKLLFTPGFLHEDELWTPTVLLKGKKIVSIRDAFYHYVVREGSITQKKDKTKNGLDLLIICNLLYAKLNDLNNPVLVKLLKNHISMRYMHAVSMGKLYRNEYKNHIDRLFPLRNTCIFKDRTKALLFATNLKLYCILDRYL